MTNVDSSFSMSSMLNALNRIPGAAATEPFTQTYPAVSPPHQHGISYPNPPPRYSRSPSPSTNSFLVASSPEELLHMRFQRMFDVMINDEEDPASFKEMILNSDPIELQSMASLITSDSDYFLEIARNKNGSKRLKIFLGKSDDVDTLFVGAILYRFHHIITDKHASHVALRGIRVFDKKKKEAMYEQVLHYALDIARDRYGCLAINLIITDEDDVYYRNLIYDFIAINALVLSNDTYGNFVIQHVLKLNNLRCTYDIAENLRGHCVDLSFQRYGSYVMEQLLETGVSMVVVVEELLECDVDRLLRLARNEYGNFVVGKALKVTQKEMIWNELFWGLVHKLKPFVQLFRRSPGSNIATILESVL